MENANMFLHFFKTILCRKLMILILNFSCKAYVAAFWINCLHYESVCQLLKNSQCDNLSIPVHNIFVSSRFRGYDAFQIDFIELWQLKHYRQSKLRIKISLKLVCSKLLSQSKILPKFCSKYGSNIMPCCAHNSGWIHEQLRFCENSVFDGFLSNYVHFYHSPWSPVLDNLIIV